MSVRMHRLYLLSLSAQKCFDFERALQGFEDLMAMGHKASFLHYGAMHLRGQGVPINFKKGMENIILSTEGGHHYASLFLGSLYYQGEYGVKRDYSAARFWFKKAESDGSVLVDYWYAQMYYHGNGYKRNIDKALDHLYLGFNKGDQRSRKMLEEIERLG